MQKLNPPSSENPAEKVSAAWHSAGAETLSASRSRGRGHMARATYYRRVCASLTDSVTVSDSRGDEVIIDEVLIICPLQCTSVRPRSYYYINLQ